MEATSPLVDTGLEAGHRTHHLADPLDPPRELHGLAWGVYVCLGILAILAIARTFLAAKLHVAAEDMGDVRGAFRAYVVLMVLWGGMVLISAWAFIAWFFQAYKNLTRLGVENRRFANGWAIGGWFIPIFNLIRPKLIADDLWRGSEPGVDTAALWRLGPIPKLVNWWWGLFVGQWFLFFYADQYTISGHGIYSRTGTRGLGRIEMGSVIAILAGIAAVAGIVLAIGVVSRISERLDRIRGPVMEGAQ